MSLNIEIAGTLTWRLAGNPNFYSLKELKLFLICVQLQCRVVTVRWCCKAGLENVNFSADWAVRQFNIHLLMRINETQLYLRDILNKNWSWPSSCTKVQLEQEDPSSRTEKQFNSDFYDPLAILLLFPVSDLINARILSFMGPHSAAAASLSGAAPVKQLTRPNICKQRQIINHCRLLLQPFIRPTFVRQTKPINPAVWDGARGALWRFLVAP